MTVKDENIINSLINSTRYPVSMETSRVTVNILDKVVFTQPGDLASLQEKLKEIKKTGYKIGSKEFTASYCQAVNECRETTAFNFNNNYYIYDTSFQPYHDTKNSIWTLMPYFTLNDNATYSMVDFDTSGIVAEGMAKLQELINRLTNIVHAAK